MNEELEFKLPIYYLHDKSDLIKTLKIDLEMDTTQNSIYEYLFEKKSGLFSKEIINLHANYFTNNINFLSDTQNLIKTFSPIDNYEYKNIEELFNEINEFYINTEQSDNINKGFNTIYQYVDIKYFDFLNTNSTFLQGLTLYNLTSPVLSLLVPIIMLIIPFFLIRMKNIPISLSTYIDTLLTVIKNHPIGQTIRDFGNVGWDRRIFMLTSVAFYFISIYQNIISCFKFYTNMSKIQNNLCTVKNYIEYSINSINNLNKYCGSTYEIFIRKNNYIKDQLNNFYLNLLNINLSSLSIKNLGQFGKMMKEFYELFKNDLYRDSIKYSLFLHEYINNITEMQNKVKNKSINFCKFKNSGTCKFKNAYYGPLIKENFIHNSYKLDKNLIITGPNAAGKTTLLKSTIFNIILSQQFGIGFYSNAIINPYKFIHSYINIPDTSQRDSLFQSEARRCKDILDSVLSYNNDRHFCIFDELYSGTNPNEAISTAYSFLVFLSNFSNVDFLLTTHYTSLCKLLENNKLISNLQMDVDKDNNLYNYKLIKGISLYKGGLKVLENMNYPTEILDNARTIIKDIII